MVKLHLQAFWQNFEFGKMQKFDFCLQTLKNLLLQIYLIEFLDTAHN